MYRLTAGLLAAGLVAATAAAADPAHPQSAFINEQIAARWKEAEIKRPAGKATDGEFLRRVFLDLIGRIATPEEVLDFEQDSAPNKREKLVKRLLYDNDYQPKVRGQKVVTGKDDKGNPQYLTFDYADEYAGHWADLWTVWLTSRTVDARYREQMDIWLKKAFAENRSYRDMVSQLLTATGKTNDNGAVNFILHHLGDATPRDKRGELGPFDAVPITSRVTRLFLGLQTQCTQCHDHPFNSEWVQSDFWGVNAFFRQTTRSGTPTNRLQNNNRQMGLTVVELTDSAALNPSSVVFYERRDGKLVAAKPNFLKDYAQAERGEEPNKTLDAAPGKFRTRREALARYVVTHDNFAKAYVNRIWGHLFGRGLNKEASVDDFGSHNEVVHPELLAKLAADFAQYQYDPKRLLEWVCTSDPYQLSHVAQKEYADPKYDPYFARMPLKALPPEVLFESLMTATRGESSPNAERRKQLREQWMAKLVQNFGDDEGNEMTFNGTIIQALLMMNGRELNEEIGPKGSNAVAKVVQKYSRGGSVNVDLVLDELFLMTLNRRPTGEERAKLKTIQQRGAVIKAEAPKPNPTPPAKGPRGKGPRQRPTPPTPGVVMPTGTADVTFYQDVFWALLNTNEFMLNH
ncbi:MAG TPA: DUF1549 domain-containing protein [Fimbriiglobus sp.]|jgi:hypothetical protein|nr:DUF1549 domain-containing protein [Fimbriiglobus sp.]